MDIYHIWCDLKPGESDMAFTRDATRYLQSLVDGGHMSTFRITRRKLGLASADFGEFHLQLEFAGLAQLDEAFSRVASREDPLETFHFAVNSRVTSVRFALYRDFPDPVRKEGHEKF